ncbi:MAG: hypothetical protein ACT4P6_22565 [Gemmatimonadaceae bacterium]
MKVFSQVSVALLAGALITISQDAVAQSRRADDVRWSRVPSARNDRRNDDNRGRYDNDRRYDDDRRRNRDFERLRRQRAQHIEWCRRHRNDRRCAELYRRGNNWCWDNNRDGRCDNVDFRRRDSRGVLRGDRGPDWERWLRSSGADVEALLNQPR